MTVLGTQFLFWVGKTFYDDLFTRLILILVILTLSP